MNRTAVLLKRQAGVDMITAGLSSSNEGKPPQGGGRRVFESGGAKL